MQKPFIKKAAIYCRLSAEDKFKKNSDDDSVSIQNQKAMLTRYALDNGWQIYDIYSDDDYTGSDRNRPEFNRLYSDARAHLFDIVLCKSQSRFTREMELVERIINTEFPMWGIRFIGVADFADTEDNGNKKSRQINGLVNEWYLEDMSNNIKSVLTDKRKNGSHIGAFAPYGYKKDPDIHGHLIVDEPAANVVRLIFKMFVSGITRKQIADYLNSNNIPTPAAYKYLNSSSYHAPNFTPDSCWKDYNVTSILRNEVYTGTLVQGKFASISYKSKKTKALPRQQWIRVANTHEAIIKKAVWNSAFQMLPEKKYLDNEARHLPLLLASYSRCMYCHKPLYCCQSHGKFYLRCSEHLKCPEKCSGAFMPVSELVSIIWDKYVCPGCNFKSSKDCGDSCRKSCLEDYLSSVKNIEIGKRNPQNGSIPLKIKTFS